MKANKYIARALTTIDIMNQKGMNIPLLIMSHPGFGKTSTISKYCKYRDYNLYTLIASQYSSDDILGLQTLKEDKLRRLTPAWFDEMRELASNGKRTILFLDEITCVDEWIQGPLLDLIFNRRLGTQDLPENILIIAAGNYSKDLNNTFKMSSPLVNRFLILNIWNDDFEIKEFMNDKFEKIEAKAEIEKYLGLEFQTPYFNYDKFAAWVKDSEEVVFGKSAYTEDDQYGLLGFTSIRSLGYVLKFVKEYISYFGSDNLWMRIAGDTLGLSGKREGKSMRSILFANAGKFREDTPKQEGTLLGKVESVLKKGKATENEIAEISLMLDNTSPENLTPTEVSKLSSLMKLSFSDTKLTALADQILAKVSKVKS